LNEALGLKVEGLETAVNRHKSTLYHLRSQAYRRKKQYEDAYQDAQQAIALAQQAGDEKLADYYQQEIDILEKHIGYKLGGSPNISEKRRQ
jgi:DNA-binding ferritin-like protein